MVPYLPVNYVEHWFTVANLSLFSRYSTASQTISSHITPYHTWPDACLRAYLRESGISDKALPISRPTLLQQVRIRWVQSLSSAEHILNRVKEILDDNLVRPVEDQLARVFVQSGMRMRRLVGNCKLVMNLAMYNQHFILSCTRSEVCVCTWSYKCQWCFLRLHWNCSKSCLQKSNQLTPVVPSLRPLTNGHYTPRNSLSYPSLPPWPFSWSRIRKWQ